MRGGDGADVDAERDRLPHPGLHGGAGLRQAVHAQQESQDRRLQQERGHLREEQEAMSGKPMLRML